MQGRAVRITLTCEEPDFAAAMVLSSGKERQIAAYRRITGREY